MNTTEDTPKCFVCGSDMWLDVQDREWGQAQIWKCRIAYTHGAAQGIPKKWWGTVIQYTKQRGWSHDIDERVAKARQHTLQLHLGA